MQKLERPLKRSDRIEQEKKIEIYVFMKAKIFFSLNNHRIYN